MGSFNVRKTRWEAVVDELAREAVRWPDIWCVQEFNARCSIESFDIIKDANSVSTIAIKVLTPSLRRRIRWKRVGTLCVAIVVEVTDSSLFLIVNIHFPTKSDQEYRHAIEEVETVISECPFSSRLVIAGDAQAHFGRAEESYRSIGPYTLLERWSHRASLFRALLERNNIIAINTYEINNTLDFTS